MCALGHFLESEGLATVSISLVREHAAIIKPPRTLWVPFPFGRPLGAPNDPVFQVRVLRAALDLFHRPCGPVLEDFPDDAPVETGDDFEGAICPVVFPRPSLLEDRTGLREAVLSEVAQLAPWYDVSQQRRGRTLVGLSGLSIADAVRFLDAWLAGEKPNSPIEGTNKLDALRSCGEDLKAFYFEAATARPGRTDSKRLSDWFWLSTSAGMLLKRLRNVLIVDEAADVRDVGNFMLLPEKYFDDD